MLQRLALLVNRLLAVTVREDVLRPPGAGRVMRHVGADGFELAIVSHGDAFTLFHGRWQMTELTVAPAAMRAALWFLLRWWVLGTWCGIKTRLWAWSIRVLFDEEKRRVELRRFEIKEVV